MHCTLRNVSHPDETDTILGFSNYLYARCKIVALLILSYTVASWFHSDSHESYTFLEKYVKTKLYQIINICTFQLEKFQSPRWKDNTWYAQLKTHITIQICATWSYIYIVSVIVWLIYFWQRRCLHSVSCTDMTRLHGCATQLRSTRMLDEISTLLIVSCTVSEILAGCCKKTGLVISFTSLPDGPCQDR